MQADGFGKREREAAFFAASFALHNPPNPCVDLNTTCMNCCGSERYWVGVFSPVDRGRLLWNYPCHLVIAVLLRHGPVELLSVVCHDVLMQRSTSCKGC